MAELCKLTAGEAAKIASSINISPKVIQWRTKRITVRPLLSFAETVQIVNNVMDACIDKSTGYFIPETLDFALRLNIVSMYASVEIPENMEQQYILLYATDLYDTVLNYVNKGQIEAIKSAINICASGFLRQHDI